MIEDSCEDIALDQMNIVEEKAPGLIIWFLKITFIF